MELAGRLSEWLYIGRLSEGDRAPKTGLIEPERVLAEIGRGLQELESPPRRLEGPKKGVERGLDGPKGL